MYITRKHFTVLMLALLMLLLTLPVMALGEADTAVEQEVLVPNTPIRGMIQLEKRGAVLKSFIESQDPFGYTIHTPIYEDGSLAGAVYEVRAAENVIGKEGTVWFKANELVTTITTTSEEISESELLPLGHYVITEISAPAGYVLDETHHDVILSASDHSTPVVKIGIKAENEFMQAKISLVKEKEVVATEEGDNGMWHSSLMNAPGEGFLFGLYNADSIAYPDGSLEPDTLIATGITNKDGELTFCGSFPHGEYYARELSAPEGWKLDSARYRVSISDEFATDDHEVIFNVETPIHNEIIHAEVQIAKTDITGSAYLPGTLIEVRDSDGKTICRDYTGEDGYLPAFPAVPGTYTFREILAPEGYELCTSEMAFTVNEHGEVTGQTAIADDYTRFSLLKVDSFHKPLYGVEFGLFREDGTLQASAVSDENGLVTFEKIPYGTYTIEETKPLSEYLKNFTKVPITIDGTFVNPDEPIATLENCLTEILIRKVDQNNTALAGAKVGLFHEDDQLVMTAISDAEGLIRFIGMNHGKYTIREIAAPDGYLLSHEVIHVTIDEGYTNSDTPIATITNQRKKIMCIKVDTAGAPLPGVEFNLYNASTMEKVETVVSDKNGVFTFSRFEYGDWIIRETEAPAGYCRMEDIRLHVGDDWTESQPIMCVNIPDHYEFIKTDSSGIPLAGVKFSLENDGGRGIDTYESDEDGIVRIQNLTPGVYYIKEIETLEGYSLSGEIIKLKIDEFYVVPEEMKRFVNYTVIQTGVNLAVTGIMWVGIGLIVVSGTLGLVRKHRSAKKKIH